MKLQDFSALCFDMDFTLVNYSRKKFLPMVYDVTARYLVEKKGYSKSLQNMEESDLKLMRQGLILDKNTNCFIDVSSTGEVISALRGKEFLCESTIQDIYPDKKWPSFDSYYKCFDSNSTQSYDEMAYLMFDSAFLSPAVPLIAKYIDTLTNAEADFHEKCQAFYKDIIASFTFNFHPDNFKANRGFYFPEMIKNTSLYVERASIKLKNRLKEFRDKGTVVILITASHVDYTELLMEYCYGSDWRGYFDIVCCRARKPGFFSLPANSRPFFRWNEKERSCGIDVVTELNTRDVFLEGHWTVVDKWIKCNANKLGQVAYVGDSFKSDIIPTKLFTSWNLFAVVWEGKACIKKSDGTENVEHINKKRHVTSEGWGGFFGSEDQYTITAGKLMEHSDLTLSDIEVLASIELNEDFSSSSGTGNFYDFDPR